MADPQMNTSVPKPTPKLPGDAARRITSAQLRAEEKLTVALDAFWQNPRTPELISPMDLVPSLKGHAGALFDTHAKEYLTVITDAESFEDFLHWELPEVVVKEILPPTGGSKRPGSSDVIGLLTLGEYRNRIGKVDRSAEPSEATEIWEKVTGIPFADVSERFQKCDRIWENQTGEAADYIPGFSKAEGIWERLVEDACVRAIRLKSYFPYSVALVWALRDGRSRSAVQEILLVSLQERWRGFVARWLDRPENPRLAPADEVPAQDSVEVLTATSGPLVPSDGAHRNEVVEPTAYIAHDNQPSAEPTRKALLDAFKASLVREICG